MEKGRFTKLQTGYASTVEKKADSFSKTEEERSIYLGL